MGMNLYSFSNLFHNLHCQHAPANTQPQSASLLCWSPALSSIALKFYTSQIARTTLHLSTLWLFLSFLDKSSLPSRENVGNL